MDHVLDGFLKAAALNADQLIARASKRFALSGRLSEKAKSLRGQSGALRYHGGALKTWAKGSLDGRRALRMTVENQGQIVAQHSKNVAAAGDTAAELRQLTHETGQAAGIKRPHPPMSNN